MSGTAELPTTTQLPTTTELPTTVAEKVLSKVYVVAVGLATTVAARSLVGVVWRVVTGEKPPKVDDPEVSRARASAWGLAAAAGLAATRLLVRRTGLGTPGH